MKLLDFTSSRSYDTDKYDLGYIHEFYDGLFSPIHDKVKNVLEIGIHKGGSIMLWRDFFTNATIYGIDVTRCDQLHNRERIVEITDNAYSQQIVSKFNKEQFDIVIDDGPHTLETMRFFLTHYLPLVKSGGIMVVEDIVDTSWTEELIKLIDPSIGKITHHDMRTKQKNQWHLERRAGGLDVIVIEKY